MECPFGKRLIISRISYIENSTWKIWLLIKNVKFHIEDHAQNTAKLCTAVTPGGWLSIGPWLFSVQQRRPRVCSLSVQMRLMSRGSTDYPRVVFWRSHERGKKYNTVSFLAQIGVTVVILAMTAAAC